MATRIGLEPTTPSVTGWCSNQLSYRAMIAQVRAASYRGNVLYYIEKSACCQAQICRKCNFLQKGVKTPSVCSLWSQPPSPRGRLLAVAAKFPVKAIKLADVAEGVKKQNAQVPKNLCVMAGVVSFELTARGFGDRCSTS